MDFRFLSSSKDSGPVSTGGVDFETELLFRDTLWFDSFLDTELLFRETLALVLKVLRGDSGLGLLSKSELTGMIFFRPEGVSYNEESNGIGGL